MRASCRKRSFVSESPQPSGVRILTATVLPITVSLARYTCDMPPPRNSRSSYLPRRAGSCMLLGGFRRTTQDRERRREGGRVNLNLDRADFLYLSTPADTSYE